MIEIPYLLFFIQFHNICLQSFLTIFDSQIHCSIPFDTMASKKLFVVFGATGTQGGSVIKSMLTDPKASAEFKLRGITRDPSKPNAQALAAKGVECVTVRFVPFVSVKSDELYLMSIHG